MGDSLKITKDKRHRSSSSIAGAGVEGTRSERRIDIRGLIPEDDHFAVAESRCDELQQKLDLVKALKRKKKLNKRSVTRLSEVPTNNDSAIPFISVRTQPKKKMPPQVTRLHRIEGSQNPARGYVDPTTLEQHRMLDQVWGYGQQYNQQSEFQAEQRQRARPRRNRADGDGMRGLNSRIGQDMTDNGAHDADASASEIEAYDQRSDEPFHRQNADVTTLLKKRSGKESRKHPGYRSGQPARLYPNQTYREKKQQQDAKQQNVKPAEERSVVELFNKRRSSDSPEHSPAPLTRKEDKRTRKTVYNTYEKSDREEHADESDVSVESFKKPTVACRRKIRHRSYEQPTVASQLKHADARYHYSVANRSNIPFVVSKSTAPSHNIGVNIQQVLNGVKMQQPLNGIPLTIAHHMGLGHVPTYNVKKLNKQVKPSLDKCAINAITVGKRLVVLPSRRSISYNRLLSMYTSGDGMVSRFLRSISRPNNLYTSMYDLQNIREDGECTGPAGRAMDPETKRRFEEYTRLYDEYQKLDLLHKAGRGSEETARRFDELVQMLLERENILQKIYKNEAMPHKTMTNTSLTNNYAGDSNKLDRDTRSPEPYGQNVTMRTSAAHIDGRRKRD